MDHVTPPNTPGSAQPAKTKRETAYFVTIRDNLFTKPVFTELQNCMDQGEAAGDQAFPRKQNPYPTGSARREWWDAGWSKSYDELCGT